MPLKATKNKLKAWRERNWKEILKENRLFLCIILIPNILFIIYTTLIETREYESFAEIVVKDNTKSATSLSALALIAPTANSQELEMIKRFIFSHDLLMRMNELFELDSYYKKMYGIDVVSPYYGTNIRDFMEYFKKKVKIEVDKENQIMRVYMRDADAKRANEMLLSILNLSENFINNVNEKTSEKQIVSTNIALATVMEKIKMLQTQIAQRQISGNAANPRKEFEQLQATVVGLEAELIKQKSTLAEISTYLNPNSIQVITAKQKIAGFEAKLRDMKKKMLQKEVDSGSSIDFAALEVEMQLLFEEYKMALGVLEQAKLGMVYNTKHVVVITDGFVADYATYPKILYNIIFFLFITFSAFIIVKGLTGIIREHEGY